MKFSRTGARAPVLSVFKKVFSTNEFGKKRVHFVIKQVETSCRYIYIRRNLKKSSKKWKKVLAKKNIWCYNNKWTFFERREMK